MFITRYVNMKPEFLYRKYTFEMIKNILFEVLPIASYTFFPPVWQWWMPREKSCRSFEANQSSRHFRTFS